MYEEDRLTALSMYERMFDETADEQGLLELLVSPTRQAVVLARSYDAKERKLQMQNQGHESEPEDAPSFVFVIDKVAQQAQELGAKLPPVSDDQFSIFDETAEFPEPEAEAEEENEAEAMSEELEAAAESNVEETAAAVDAFLADFSVENGELVSAKEEAEAPAEEPEAEAEVVEVPAVQTRQKVNVFLLILYIFVAIPVGLAGTIILLLPTALCLSLAAGCGFTGVSAIGSFASFAVIADTMVVIGAGLICLALALLLLWMFIWFLVSVIPGFIRGICRLGRKICCKEVAVQ